MTKSKRFEASVIANIGFERGNIYKNTRFFFGVDLAGGFGQINNYKETYEHYLNADDNTFYPADSVMVDPISEANVYLGGLRANAGATVFLG